MININVFSNTNVDIESKEYNIETQEDMIKFIKDLIDRVEYGGERICLEQATIDTEKGVVGYTTIERWRG